MIAAPAIEKLKRCFVPGRHPAGAVNALDAGGFQLSHMIACTDGGPIGPEDKGRIGGQWLQGL